MSSPRLAHVSSFAGLPALAALAALAFGSAQACSSSDSAPANNGACPGDPFSTSGIDAVKITKADACARYVAALQKQADSMTPKCTLDPVPQCPDVLDKFEADTIKANPGLCVDGYSQGAITNCVCRIASYTSCSDFSTKPCVIGIIPKPAGTTCDSDAGTDSGDDAFDTSPLDDAPADAADGGAGD